MTYSCIHTLSRSGTATPESSMSGLLTIHILHINLVKIRPTVLEKKDANGRQRKKAAN